MGAVAARRARRRVERGDIFLLLVFVVCWCLLLLVGCWLLVVWKLDGVDGDFYVVR